MKKVNEQVCDYPDADYSPTVFNNYKDFLNWVYEIKDSKTQTYPRTKHKFIDGFYLKTEPTVIYHKVMDCLHAHEEG